MAPVYTPFAELGGLCTLLRESMMPATTPQNPAVNEHRPFGMGPQCAEGVKGFTSHARQHLAARRLSGLRGPHIRDRPRQIECDAEGVQSSEILGEFVSGCLVVQRASANVFTTG